jgi:hypothetical protein
MDNLTFVQKVIKPHTVDPLEGHTVVVIEQIGEAGEEFRFEIEPGQRVPKSGIDLFKWLRGGRGGPNYFAYAVTDDPGLRFKFSVPVKMDTQAHSFMLVVSVDYRVASPRLVVTRRNADPIQKLREEISLKMQREFASRSWISIRNEFREIEREAIAATLQSLREFAGRYGLEIRDLSLSYELQEKDFIDVTHEAALDQQTEVQKREAEFERLKVVEESKITAVKNEQAHEEALRQKRREHELLTLEQMQHVDRSKLEAAVAARLNLGRIGDAATEAAVTAIRTAGGSIRTPAELLAAFTALVGAVGGARALIEGNGDSAVPSIAGLLPQAGVGQNGAGAVIGDMLVHTGFLGLDRLPKQQLQSAILHLIAELLLEREAEASIIDKYRDQLEKIRSEANLPIEHFDYLKKFVDTDKLRSELG